LVFWAFVHLFVGRFHGNYRQVLVATSPPVGTINGRAIDALVGSILLTISGKYVPKNCTCFVRLQLQIRGQMKTKSDKIIITLVIVVVVVLKRDEVTGERRRLHNEEL
jgi:ABC-type branched-subunit amino acid transport system permease subunit